MWNEFLLVQDFTHLLFDYVKEQLNESNCCLIYDQFIKINKEDEPLEHFKEMVMRNTKETFESDHFIKISEDTLVSFLNLDELKILEIDLLRACSKWIDYQLVESGLDLNKANKQNLFNRIKNLIRFADMKVEEIADFEEINCLLTNSEIANLFFHLISKKNELKIECKSQRRYGIDHLLSVFSVCAEEPSRDFTRSTYLKVSHRVRIRTIYSTVPNRVLDFKLIIQNSSDETLELNIKRVIIDGRWCFNFKDHFVCEANVQYKLKFIDASDGRTQNDQLSREKHLKLNEIVFQLDFGRDFLFHCISRIDFS